MAQKILPTLLAPLKQQKLFLSLAFESNQTIKHYNNSTEAVDSRQISIEPLVQDTQLPQLYILSRFITHKRKEEIQAKFFISVKSKIQSWVIKLEEQTTIWGIYRRSANCHWEANDESFSSTNILYQSSSWSRTASNPITKVKDHLNHMIQSSQKCDVAHSTDKQHSFLPIQFLKWTCRIFFIPRMFAYIKSKAQNVHKNIKLSIH